MKSLMHSEPSQDLTSLQQKMKRLFIGSDDMAPFVNTDVLSEIIILGSGALILLVLVFLFFMAVVSSPTPW
jgi:hypothetical protein